MASSTMESTYKLIQLM